MAWLDGILGADTSQGVKLTVLFVVLLIALLLIVWLFRKIFGGPTSRFNKNRQPRLSVTDAAVVDDKRRLVLVRRDNIEHLVMIGGPSDIVIEQNIIRAAPVPMPQTTGSATSHPTVASPATSAPQPQTRTEPAIPETPAPQAAPNPPVEPASNSATIGAGVAAAGAGLVTSASETTSATVDAVSDTAKSMKTEVTESVSNVVESVGEGTTNAVSSLTGLADKAVEAVTPEPSVAPEPDLAGDLSDALGVSEPSVETPAEGTGSTKTENEMDKLLKELAEEKK